MIANTMIFIIITFSFKYYNLNIIMTLYLFYYLFLQNFENFFNEYKNMRAIKYFFSSSIYCITGFYFANISLIKIINNKKDKIFLFIIPFIIIIKEKTNIFLFFSLLPFDKINNHKIILIVKYLTSFTGGIYYIHRGVVDLLYPYDKKIFVLGNFKSIICIYLLCYFICAVGRKASKKSKLIYLFG